MGRIIYSTRLKVPREVRGRKNHGATMMKKYIKAEARHQRGSSIRLLRCKFGKYRKITKRKKLLFLIILVCVA